MYEVIVPLKKWMKTGDKSELANYFSKGTVDDVAQAYELSFLVGKGQEFIDLLGKDSWVPGFSYDLDGGSYLPFYRHTRPFTVIGSTMRKQYVEWEKKHEMSVPDGLDHEVYIKDDETDKLLRFLARFEIGQVNPCAPQVVGFVARLFPKVPERKIATGEIIRWVTLDLAVNLMRQDS